MGIQGGAVLVLPGGIPLGILSDRPERKPFLLVGGSRRGLLPSIPNAALASAVHVLRAAALMNMNAPQMDSFLMGDNSPTRAGRGLQAPVSGGCPTASAPSPEVPYSPRYSYDMPFYLAAALYAAGISLIYVSFRRVESVSQAKRREEYTMRCWDV